MFRMFEFRSRQVKTWTKFVVEKNLNWKINQKENGNLIKSFGWKLYKWPEIMANREILHSLFASFCGGFDIFEANLFINATHLYLFIILLSLPFIIFMVREHSSRVCDCVKSDCPQENQSRAIASLQVTSHNHCASTFSFIPLHNRLEQEADRWLIRLDCFRNVIEAPFDTFFVMSLFASDPKINKSLDFNLSNYTFSFAVLSYNDRHMDILLCHHLCFGDNIEVNKFVIA